MRGFLNDRDLQDGSLSCPVADKRAPEVVLGKHLNHVRKRQMGKRTSLERELLSLHKGGLEKTR